MRVYFGLLILAVLLGGTSLGGRLLQRRGFLAIVTTLIAMSLYSYRVIL